MHRFVEIEGGPMSSEIGTVLDALYDDFDAHRESFRNEHGKFPLLAHYTSLEALGKILKSSEFWLSNPRFMNDHAEVTFAFNKGIEMALKSDLIRAALKTDTNWKIFHNGLRGWDNLFLDKHLINIYVLSFSMHEEGNDDGVLSMWRAYGQAGANVALIVDPNPLNQEIADPIYHGPVSYKSPEAQIEWIQSLTNRIADVFAMSSCSMDAIQNISWAFLNRLLVYALFTKHKGFAEEREWRIAYIPIRDPENSIEDLKTFVVSHRGVEPKLRLSAHELNAADSSKISLDNVISRILLGPSRNSELMRQTTAHMLACLKKPHLVNVIRTSQIPLRIS